MSRFSIFIKKNMNVDSFLLVASAFNVAINIYLCLQHFLSQPDNLDALFAHAWTESGIAPVMIVCSGIILYGCIKRNLKRTALSTRLHPEIMNLPKSQK
ncbi:hypothetical protein D2K34_22835 [Salmonella enterica subsp. enterica serovar Ohio]|jgi:hypothetical protein|nr:hypothetical protein [Salmonella enterica subsp. enterica serovar Ohio]